MKGFLTFILLNVCLNIYTQSLPILVNENYIPNAGFEAYYSCPGKFERKTNYDISLAVGWASPTNGTPDYYNVCGNDERSIPQYHFINPAYGDACAGIITWKPHSNLSLGGPKGWREYIYIVLKKPLVKDQQYLAELWYALSPLSKFFCHDIGMLFTSENIYNKQHVNSLKEITLNSFTKRNVYLSNLQPSVSNNNTDTNNLYMWKKMSQVFTAKGGERYLYIGNFNNNDESNYGVVLGDKTDINKTAENAYYLIDNVSTKPYIDQRIKKKKLPDVGESFQLTNIYFNLDSYELLSSTKRILDRMKQIFVDYDGLSIEIQGHTDDYGSNEYNSRLSSYRARAIYNYLLDIGCPKQKMKYKGYGETKPLVPNTTEKNREINRRVEFKILAR